jgi:hypothetical protein
MNISLWEGHDDSGLFEVRFKPETNVTSDNAKLTLASPETPEENIEYQGIIPKVLKHYDRWRIFQCVTLLHSRFQKQFFDLLDG